ncbi:MAG: hypothetical protein LQ338_001970 [Usnochroma carphineum]|nr:MAG: hypothetical protein LQ338_001970 [Usnochroma carphineum]
MSTESVQTRLNEPYDIHNWTVQDSIKCQNTVEDFMNLLRSGQLRKSKHQKLVDTFVKWVQQDAFWGLALPIAPELREGEVDESLISNFPKGETKDLFHVEEIVSKLERIHRPLSEKELREQEEWKELWEKAGASVVGSPEWYENIKQEHGQAFVDFLKAEGPIAQGSRRRREDGEKA